MNSMLRSNGRILWHLLGGLPRADTLKDRLDGFYRPQAEYYDDFRSRLLQGRQKLLQLLDISHANTIVELGAGTGQNLEFYRGALHRLKWVEVVDVCPALLDKARQRCRQWPNVQVVEADATDYSPREPVDRVYFSYSLTMIPDWFKAIDNAVTMLKPGGLIGVVDFYISRNPADNGTVEHGILTRWFWPIWFAHDGVHLSSDHLPYLEASFERLHRLEARSRIPFTPGFQVPYYVFVGRKPGE
jgi:S-adenosylmethionine-diacylgycerolhomoserine-N-methlytransferase